MLLKSLLLASFCIFLVVACPPPPAFPQSIHGVPMCRETIQVWEADPNMRQYMEEHDCDCRNGESSAPVCEERHSSQAGQSAPTSRQGSGAIRYNSSDAVKMAVIQGLKNSLDQMTRPNPAAIRKFTQEGNENARYLNQAQESAEQSVEARRQQAVEREAAEQSRASMELSGELQGVPGIDKAPPPVDIADTLNEDTQRRQLAGMQLKSVQQSSSAAARAKGPAADAYARDEAGKGFDTKGRYAGALTTVEEYKKTIPKEKMTPKIKELLHEREEMQGKKKELAKKLSVLYEKKRKTPQDTVDIVKLQGEISQVQNMENFNDFSVNEELAKPPEEDNPK
jgi:hypothetical protein